MARQDQPTDMITGAEAARMFGVNSKTVARWAKDGKLKVRRTMGGHRRYSRAEIQAILDGQA